jgi:hypothetical protein
MSGQQHSPLALAPGEVVEKRSITVCPANGTPVIRSEISHFTRSLCNKHTEGI